jgi:hypothetical protein
MTKVNLKTKSFRYRAEGKEQNYTVLTTNRNQTRLRGFDISDLTPEQVNEVQSAWKKVSYRDMTLSKKEASTIARCVYASFKTFQLEKVRYFHKKCLVH